MSPFDVEFNKIIERYEEYINSAKHNDINRIDYINAQYNSINLIMKMIAVSSTGEPIETKVAINSDTKRALQNKLFNREPPVTYSTEHTNDGTGETMEEVNSDTLTNNPLDSDPIYTALSTMTTGEMFVNELNAWGIAPDTLAYKCIAEIPKCCNSKMNYDEAITALAEHLGYNKGIISISLNRIIKAADFSKTLYNPMLKKCVELNKDITKELIISELLEFCEE